MSLWTAMHRAAVAWRTEVVLVSEGVERFRMPPRCACKGFGVVPVAYRLRGELRWNFVTCVCQIKRKSRKSLKSRGGVPPRRGAEHPGWDSKSPVIPST